MPDTYRWIPLGIPGRDFPASHEFRGDGELLDDFFLEFAVSCRPPYFALA